MQKNTQNTPPTHQKNAVLYIRTSSRKDAKTAAAAQTKAAERYAQSAALSITDVFAALGFSGESPTISNQLKQAMAKAATENKEIVAANFARFGRNRNVLLDFIRSCERLGITWRCPNIVGSDGKEISNNSTSKEINDAFAIVEQDFKNRSENAIKRVETHGTNLVTTPTDRQKGATATQAKAAAKLPKPVKEHVAMLLYTTSKSLQSISDTCNEIAKNDTVFAGYAPFHRMKIKRIQDVLESENRINGV